MSGYRAAAVAVLTVVALGGAAVAASEKALSSAQPVATIAAGPPAVIDRALPPPPPPLPPPAPRSPCQPVARVCVQLSTSTAWLRPARRDVLGPVPVRHGRPDSPTPTGTWPVQSKNAGHVSSVDGSPMPFAMFFAGDLALYEADLTRPSAGSVRLGRGTAAEFFAATAVGDLVQVVP